MAGGSSRNFFQPSFPPGPPPTLVSGAGTQIKQLLSAVQMFALQ